MKVICAGWGRTGTRSLKYALEHLTGQPSYHMQNILLNKKDAKKWHNSIFLHNEKFNWEDIYKGYGACLDFPSCNYYKDLMDYYPDAKVILTIRDSESWVKSWNVLNKQILRSFTFRFLAKIPRTSFQLQKDIHNKMILGLEGAFQGVESDKERMKKFDEWNKAVIEYVPKERLLVYQVKEGWAPLCKFLNVEEPNIPFFYKNKTKNMRHMSRFINTMFVFVLIFIIVVIISSVFFGVQYFG